MGLKKRPDGKYATGRPAKEIDMAQVIKLCGIQCTGQEIASVIGVHYDTLERKVVKEYKITLAEFIKRNSATGKASLRRLQWKSAERGNTGMLIWLGKQYLGQTEKQELTGKDGGPIECSSESPRERIERRIALLASRTGSESNTEEVHE